MGGEGEEVRSRVVPKQRGTGGGEVVDPAAKMHSGSYLVF